MDVFGRMFDLLQDPLYYTPTIEEFYVGFEYEEFLGGTKGGWRKAICNVDTFAEEYSMSWLDEKNNTFTLRESTSGTRVKVLDSEDFKELGWEECGRGGYYDFGEFQAHGFPGRVVIYEKDAEIIFAGAIKNKSELKKVMAMCHIWKE